MAIRYFPENRYSQIRPAHPPHSLILSVIAHGQGLLRRYTQPTADFSDPNPFIQTLSDNLQTIILRKDTAARLCQQFSYSFAFLLPPKAMMPFYKGDLVYLMVFPVYSHPGPDTLRKFRKPGQRNRFQRMNRFPACPVFPNHI